MYRHGDAISVKDGSQREIVVTYVSIFVFEGGGGVD